MDDFVLIVFRGDSVMFKKSEIVNLIKDEWFLANVLEAAKNAGFLNLSGGLQFVQGSGATIILYSP